MLWGPSWLASSCAKLSLRWDSRGNVLGVLPRRIFPCMAIKAILAGLVLIVLGVVASIASDSSSFTSWIPSIVGLVLLGLGVAGRTKPDLNHHLMPAAAAIALLALLGSVGSAIGRGATGWALFAQVGTALVTGVFLAFAVQSFRSARSDRLQAGNA